MAKLLSAISILLVVGIVAARGQQTVPGILSDADKTAIVESVLEVELRHVPDNANSSKGTEGAAHLKNRDTPPPNFGAVAFTFVNAALTLLTHVFIILRAFALTLLTRLSTFVDRLLTAVYRPNKRQVAVTLPQERRNKWLRQRERRTSPFG